MRRFCMDNENENIEITPEPVEVKPEGMPINQTEEYKNKYLRALADLENYKKRAVIERDNFIQFANEDLVVKLLPTLDGFDRAFCASDNPNGEEILKGVALLKRQMFDTLAKFGLEEINAVGKPFDPHFHEAIMKKESDKPENTVIEEMQKGYTLRGRVIRAAM